MKFRIHENGWTVFCEDIDLAQVTQEEVDQIAEYISSNTLVIFKKQNLRAEDQLRLGRMLGEVKDYTDIIKTDTWGRVDRLKSMLNIPGGENCLHRVTGQKDENGLPGLHGKDEELGWHCDDPYDHSRTCQPIGILYAVKDTIGSITEWTNSIPLYNSLDVETKKKLDSLEFTGVGAKAARFLHGEKYSMMENEPDMIIKYPAPRKLVQTTEFGVTGLFFPIQNIDRFIGYTEKETQELIQWISELYLKEPYVYSHHWEDGDCLLAEQWLAIHRRLAFKDMSKRLLWRLTTDFSNTLGKR